MKTKTCMTKAKKREKKASDMLIPDFSPKTLNS